MTTTRRSPDRAHPTRPRLARVHGHARACLPLALLAAAPTLGAQTVAGRPRATETGSAYVQARCARAAAALLSDTAAAVPAWLYGAIGDCERSGPDAIAHAWGAIRGDDQDQMNALVAASRAVRDQRIFDAESAALRDGQRPNAVRLAAVDALVGYAVPDAAAYPISASSASPYLLRATDIPTPLVGAQPLDPSVAWYIYSSLVQAGWRTDLASADPETVNGRAALAASALFTALTAARPALGDVTLTAVCGTQFRVRSRVAPVALLYTVVGSGFPAAEVGVQPSAATTFNAPVAGTVQVTYAGVVLATAQSSGQTCP